MSEINGREPMLRQEGLTQWAVQVCADGDTWTGPVPEEDVTPGLKEKYPWARHILCWYDHVWARDEAHAIEIAKRKLDAVLEGRISK